ncbi:MAG: acyloxyacyl hydrolase [Acidobacteriota bacterium]|nr:acyloxyacyl hydrolase [Acidobacteriota bacterium]
MRFLLLMTTVLSPVLAAAQAGDDAASLRRPNWNVAATVGGGPGLVDRSNVQFIRGGVRLSRVFTHELGTGPLRGTFEEGIEFNPVDEVLWKGRHDFYGFSVNPIVAKWNFTASRKVVPYFMIHGGMLHTNQKVPPPNTSTVNFTTGGGFGVQYFLKPGRSISWDVCAIHLSNASLGDHNPGVNASLQFQLSYIWWKH